VETRRGAYEYLAAKVGKFIVPKISGTRQFARFLRLEKPVGLVFSTAMVNIQ